LDGLQNDECHAARGRLQAAPRGLLQTVKTPTGEPFFRLSTLNLLEIRQYIGVNARPIYKKMLTIRHSAGLKKPPTFVLSDEISKQRLST